MLDELRAYMKRNKITQEEMARQLGITRPQLNRILNRKSGASFRVAQAIYAILRGEITNRCNTTRTHECNTTRTRGEEGCNTTRTHEEEDDEFNRLLASIYREKV